MTPTMDLRPTPGTAELLEVLDRTLSGGIIIEEEVAPVELTTHVAEGRIFVSASESCLGHAVANATGPPP